MHSHLLMVTTSVATQTENMALLLVQAAHEVIARASSVSILCWLPNPLQGLDYAVLTPQLKREVRHQAICKARKSLEACQKQIHQYGVQCFLELWWEGDPEPPTLCGSPCDAVLTSKDTYTLFENLSCVQGKPVWLMSATGHLADNEWVLLCDAQMAEQERAPWVEAVTLAVSLAEQVNSRLHLVSVIPSLGTLTAPATPLRQQLVDAHEAFLGSLLEQAAGNSPVEVVILEGQYEREIEAYLGCVQPGLVFAGQNSKVDAGWLRPHRHIINSGVLSQCPSHLYLFPV